LGYASDIQLHSGGRERANGGFTRGRFIPCTRLRAGSGVLCLVVYWVQTWNT
jgi:hypothetical protein